MSIKKVVINFGSNFIKIEVSNMNKKKVILFMTTMYTGGIENALIELLNKLDYEKYDVTLFLENKKDTLSEEDLQMTLYILNESEKLEKELRDKFEDIPIQRPKWNQK